MKEKNKLGKGLKVLQSAVPAFPGFVGNGYVQPAGTGGKGSPTWQYNTYVTSEECNMKDGVTFSYGCLLGSLMGFLSDSTAGKDDVGDRPLKQIA